MEDIRREALDGIRYIERELIVRDFVALLNAGAAAELLPFLTEDASYHPSRSDGVIGRAPLLRMFDDIRAHFDEWTTELVTVAVIGDTVLTEQVLRLRLPGGSPCEMLGFGSFRLDGARIRSWHQVQG